VDPLVLRAVLLAEDAYRRGVRESGAPNRGPEVEEYQRGYGHDRFYLVGERWCAVFATYCYERAAGELGLPSPLLGWRRGSSPRTDSDLASASKILESTAHPPSAGYGRRLDQPVFGCLGLFVAPNHVTLVVDPRPGKKTCVTIEGNFRNRVEMVLREKTDFRAFVRVV